MAKHNDDELREELSNIINRVDHLKTPETPEGNPFLLDNIADHEAVDELMQLIKQREEQAARVSFERGRAVGKYQAADSLYGHTTTMWVFKDGDLNDKKFQYPERINELLKDCESLMNTNAREYTKYIRQLTTNYKGETQ